MAKLIASLGAFFLYGSLGAASISGNISQGPFATPERLEAGARAQVDTNDLPTPEAESNSSTSVLMGEMSDEEKERRRQVCDKMNDDCYDRCDRYFPRKPTERGQCKDDCKKSYEYCLKQIR